MNYGQNRKQHKRKNSISQIGMGTAKKDQLVVPKKVLSFAAPLKRYPQVSTDIDFLLTSSSSEMPCDNTVVNRANEPDQEINKQIYDHRDVLSNRKTDLNLSEIIRNEETFKETLFNIPHCFTLLKCEYQNMKGKYEKTLDELVEKRKVCDLLAARGKELAEESAKKSETLLQLAVENEGHRNERKVLETYREEKDALIEVLKKDSESRGEEIERLIRENGELRCENTRLQTQREMEERMARETRQKFQRLEAERQCLKAGVEAVKTVVEGTIARYLKSDIHGRIEQVEQENRKLVHYETYLSVWRSRVVALSQETTRLAGRGKECSQEICRRVDDLVNEMAQNRREGAEQCKRIANAVGQAKAAVNEAVLTVLRMKETLSIEAVRGEFVRVVGNMKGEFETQRQGYEKKIKELTDRIEEQEDVWAVFK